MATGDVAAAARSAPLSGNEINALPPLGLIRSDLGCRGSDAANDITQGAAELRLKFLPFQALQAAFCLRRSR